ncbi:PGR5-like protein 1B [Carex littledalei]|uniref:PGR5-like protein 1B n=1 Tax=Carex littledalei TaxID=544730 RepID=A0A833VPQ9_9POAL|nr:PGR5-like protein 1B [Carex littledalei]
MPSSSPYSTRTGLLHFRRTVARAAASGHRGLTGSTLAVSEGPSCLFVGPIETASKEMLEALYRQARDSYYSGKPLIVDDMFDKVELKLRLYGSKYVVKYPRCSIRRQLTYADAEEDQSLVFALVSIWLLLLTFGTSAFLIPAAYSIKSALREAFTSIFVVDQWKSPLEMLNAVSNTLLVGMGYLIGYPIASASVQALQGLWTNDLVALKGSCPNCGEEVFAFVKTNDKSRLLPHRAECHVCQCGLEYRTKVEQSSSGPRRSWVYGRVYLVRRA